jgi:glycosyltransferase involved in cell wall biosynthesis
VSDDPDPVPPTAPLPPVRPADGARILVIVPAYNEEETVGRVVKEVRAAQPRAHVLVVDDGSRDRTRQAAEAAGAEVLALPFNLGVGGALRAGFRYAVRFDYDICVQVDGDGQHDPAEIARLLDELRTADLVIGARFAGAGDYEASGTRRLAMRLLARSMSRRTHSSLTDTTSGFRAFNRTMIDLFARDYPAEYLGDTVEALLIAARAGCRVTQVPVQMRPRAGGTPSQSPVRAAGYLARVVLAVFMARVRRQKG